MVSSLILTELRVYSSLDLDFGGLMKKLRIIVGSIALVLALMFFTTFGTSILTNIHLQYLRVLSTNTVLLHNSKGAGATGFIVRGKSGKKYVMTNNHVCNLAETILGESGLFVVYKENEYFLPIVKRYSENDLCAVEAPSTASFPAMIAR